MNSEKMSLEDQIDPGMLLDAGIDLAPASFFLESRQKIYRAVER